MSLVPYDGNSSEDSSLGNSSSSDSESDVTISVPSSATTPILPPLPKFTLPKPDFVVLGGGNTNTDYAATITSVFKNPFAEAEHVKEAMLQRHVKMVDSKDNTVVINGKKICWNYRKGKCRFGHNCKFAHDSDVQKTREQLDGEKSQTTASGHSRQQQRLPQPSVYELEQIKQESIGIASNQSKRKRPGLTAGLVPGKKVMRNYVKQKQ